MHFIFTCQPELISTLLEAISKSGRRDFIIKRDLISEIGEKEVVGINKYCQQDGDGNYKVIPHCPNAALESGVNATTTTAGACVNP